jgi:hypothetical protein
MVCGACALSDMHANLIWVFLKWYGKWINSLYFLGSKKCVIRSSGLVARGLNLEGSYSGWRVRIPLRAWTFTCLLCFVVPCDELTTCPSSSTVCRK